MLRLQIFPLLLAVLAAPGPALGADPARLKETLDIVQSKAGSKAVENLIGKLKGASSKPPARPPATSTTAPQAVSAPNPVPPSSPPPATDTEAAIESAGTDAPSIDLEIFFAYKSTEIGPQAAAALEPVARTLSDPRLAGDTFLIAGHTDAKGSAEYNLALSQQRAEAVRRHLIANFGLDGARLMAKGMGMQQLKRPDEPLSAANRRVQIVNLSQGGRR